MGDAPLTSPTIAEVKPTGPEATRSNPPRAAIGLPQPGRRMLKTRTKPTGRNPKIIAVFAVPCMTL